jgi:stearoyl-CoA desaturase (delta-9 desaturase)
VVAILTFFVAHWVLSVFAQTFFLHRYAAHRMFTMSPFWERVFYFLTWVFQGSSYLIPRAYAVLHREHHAYSDTPKDPHSPHQYPSLAAMMWATKERYYGFVNRTLEGEKRFEGGVPVWEALDRLGDSWFSRIGWGTAYTLFYVYFAPHWAFFLLLPVHYLMGPIHGAIVNWCGHKYGYRNFASTDKSRNTLVFDFVTLGELFQNNHHEYGMAPNFAARWFEIDPTWTVIRALAALRIVKLSPHIQTMRWTPAAKARAPKPAPDTAPDAVPPAVLPLPDAAE